MYGVNWYKLQGLTLRVGTICITVICFQAYNLCINDNNIILWFIIVSSYYTNSHGVYKFIYSLIHATENYKIIKKIE